MKCEALAITKYLSKSPNIFFIYGSEIVLRNNSKDILKNHLRELGFSEKRIITKDQFDRIEQIIIENASGSLFGSKTLIEIHHDQGRIPDQITKIFQIANIEKMNNIAIIITSHNEKLNYSTKWVKQMDENSLIVECKKLKSFEEKIWLKKELSFVSEKDRSTLLQHIYEMNLGNLVAQQNEIQILRLVYEDGMDMTNIFSADSAEFVPFELEDMIISKNTKHALRIVHSIKTSEGHYAPLLVWIIGKIVNNSSNARQNKNPRSSLERSGVWGNKITEYMNFIKIHPLQKLIRLQKDVFELDLASKGLSKKDFWNELDNIVIELTAS